MSQRWRQSPQMIRRRPSGKLPLLLCLCVSCLTAIAVYRWGREKWCPVTPEPKYTATAYVIERPRNATTADGAETGRDQSARANDARAGENRVPMVSTDDDPQQAAKSANTSAERYVAQRRAQWRAQMESPCLKARESLEKAGQDYKESAAQLATFERQLRDSAEAAARAKPAVEALQSAPTMVDNPRWVELRSKLTEFERRREQLLTDRTPLHPAVQEIAARIAEVQVQLAAVPRQIPSPRADVARAAETPAANVGWPNQNRVDSAAGQRLTMEDRVKLDDLATAVRHSGEARDAAELVVKRAEQQQQGGPQLAIQYAQTVETPPQIDYGWRRLVWSTFSSGALIAFGLGMVSLGAGIRPPVASVAEVEAALGGTVLGTIPADDPMADATAAKRQARTRRTAIAVGLLLIVACPFVAILGVLGI